MKVVSVWFCAAVFLLGVYSDDSLKATYENEELVCDKHEAVSRIEKIPVDGPYGKDYRFKIDCLHFNVCREKCEWSDACTEKHYGDGVFIAGIKSLYYNPTGERYLALLCCKSPGKPDGCKPFKNYTGSSYVISTTEENEIIRQALVNHELEEKPWLNAEICQYNSSKKCIKIQARGRGGGNAYPLAAAAAGGALAGLTGLAALGFVGELDTKPLTNPTTISTILPTVTTPTTPTTITVTTPTTTRITSTLTAPCPEWINCVPAVCIDQFTYQYQGYNRLTCQSACWADLKCAAWDLSGSRCSIYYAVCSGSRGKGGFSGTNKNLIYCERNMQYSVTGCTSG